MIIVRDFFKILNSCGINYYTGVPDSILKNLNKFLKNKKNHLITSNEGASIGLAVGNYLSSKKITCVYLQNSGLGNAINPLVSLANKEVYNIPILLLIGWRGKPGVEDEPQHKLQGKITKKILKIINIKYEELKNNTNIKLLKNKIKLHLQKKRIFALLINKNVFKDITDNKVKKISHQLERDDCIDSILKYSNKKSKIITSTGYISRNAYKYNQKYKRKVFYNVGAMGHTQMIARGIANFNKSINICIDGDGSLIMHMGSLANLVMQKRNLTYILLNNGMHESVGGQECISKKINFKLLSKSLGFKKYLQIKKKSQLKNLKQLLAKKNNFFININLKESKSNQLPRVANFENIKNLFIK